MAEMKVSVVVPCFNVQEYLHSCIDSILGQTIKGIEVICIDDGSKDNCLCVLNQYAENNSCIRVVSQCNKGQGSARNHGLEVVQGEYVCFVDADDELLRTDALELLVNEAKRESLDVLFFDAELKYDDNMEDDTTVKKDMYIRRHDYSSVDAGSKLFALMSMNGEYSPSPCLAIYRREFLEENNIRFPSERIFYEDNIFMTRVLLAAKRASHRPWRFYLRKVHAGSTVTSKPTMRHLRGYLACYRDVCETLSREAWDAKTRKALLDRCVVYKLNVRRIADFCPDLVVEAKVEMLKEEYDELCKVLVYPLGEKIVNGFRCLCEHGPRYTLKRILFGRQR